LETIVVIEPKLLWIAVMQNRTDRCDWQTL